MRRFFTIAVHDAGVYDLELADDALQSLSHFFYHDSPVFADLEAHVHFSNRRKSVFFSSFSSSLFFVFFLSAAFFPFSLPCCSKK